MKNKKVIGIVVAIVVVVLIGIFALGKGNVKNKTMTAENFDEISEKLKDSLSEDEACYFSYACMQYMLKDGLSAALTDSDNEEAMYKSIYGKKVGDMIEEGKQLMKEDNTTVEQFKENLKEAENLIQQ